ncbi:MAG: creatininase family protein, partial [Thermogemmatispora sp.]|nr:creatininase family protein [Thermogemmatispora sp.]
MSWTELDHLDRERTVILMSAGPLEQHGPHLPVGTDVFAAEEVTRRLL